MRRAHLRLATAPWLLPLSLLILLATGVAATGCGSRPGFRPAAGPKVPTSGEPAARARFEEARARFERQEYEGADDEFKAIRREYPDDPIAPYATLYAGMASYRAGDHAAAAATLAALVDDVAADEDMRARARFWLGLSEARLGRYAQARARLEPFRDRVEGDDRTELVATLAAAAAAAGQVEDALVHYDEFFARGRPAERAYVGERVRELVDGLQADAAARAYARADKRGPAAAYLGLRLAAAARAAGDAGAARRFLQESAAARAAIGLEDQRAVGNEDPDVVGALLPLSGRRRLIGEAAQRGVAIAAGTFDRISGAGVAASGIARPFAVVVRDSGERPGRAAAALDELVAEGAIAVVGPVDKVAAEEAARRAEAMALPLVTLDVTESGVSAGSPHVFRVVVSVEERARALAAHAIRAGARRFAVLAPEIAYGTRATEAFQAEVQRLGGRIATVVRYPKGTTSFVNPVARLARTRFDALFVPDSAATLELIAPQLAVADLVVQRPGARSPRRRRGRGRGIQLFATAEALSPRFLRGSGRYTTGAILAPGFYPDELHPRVGSFVARFRAAYGEDPTWLDAYAHDAALVIRAAVEAGADSRASVAAAIGGLGAAPEGVPGVTGDVRFDRRRERADRGFLYVVVDDGGTHAIRVVGPERTASR